MRQYISYLQILVGKSEGKRPVGRPRLRLVVNINMDLREIGLGWYGLDRSGYGEGPVQGSCEHGNEPLGSIKCGEVVE
jgi:hypothetical protein